MNVINSSPVSKPFVISAVILLFFGSSVGAIWNMSLYGIPIPSSSSVIPLHKVIQLDGFLSLLIMGIGYMIVPRFRNAPLKFPKFAYMSYLLVIASVGVSFLEHFVQAGLNDFGSYMKIAGIMIFSMLVLNVIREKPKLLPNADYFVVLSVSTFFVTSFFRMMGIFPNPILNEIHLWLLFPIMMIFGVQYKTLPSLLGFIRPKEKTSLFAIASSATTCILAVVTVFYPPMGIIFNLAMMAMSLSMAYALFIFGGFDKSEIKGLFSGEKKVRYHFTELLTKIAYIFLVAGIIVSILNKFDPDVFAYYDLGIHFITIGFIGFTILLYFPIMIPPILNRTVHFLKFSKIPIYLVISALAMRVIGDFIVLEGHVDNHMLSQIFGSSVWLIVAALFVFVINLHKSMKPFRSNLRAM